MRERKQSVLAKRISLHTAPSLDTTVYLLEG